MGCMSPIADTKIFKRSVCSLIVLADIRSIQLNALLKVDAPREKLGLYIHIFYQIYLVTFVKNGLLQFSNYRTFDDT